MVKLTCKQTKNNKTGIPYKTYVVTIPKAIVDSLDLQDKQLDIKQDGKHIILIPLEEEL